MLSEIHLQNFKSHKDTCITLDNSRLHALVGQNASGKTSVLQAVNYLSQIAQSSFQKIFQSSQDSKLDSLVTFGESSFSLSIDGNSFSKFICSFDKASNNHWEPYSNLFLDPSIAEDTYHALVDGGLQELLEELHEDIHESLSEGILQKMPSNDEIVYIAMLRQGFNPWKYPIHEIISHRELELQERFPLATYLKLFVSNLSKPDYSHDIHPSMQPDGSGLASSLADLRDQEPYRFEYLQKMMCKIVPGVQRIGVGRVEVVVHGLPCVGNNKDQSINADLLQKVIGHEVVLDMNSGKRIPAHSLSEGTLLTLGLLTALMSPQRPSLILLEDIQQGLHPKAQRDIISILKELLKLDENLQIIFSTHSPYILDALEPSQVHVLSTAKTGYTQTKRLDEHPRAEWAKQTLTTGEFWDAVEEDWVTEE